MIRTRVGYAGGTSVEPNYERIGDHAEAIEVDFDPQRLSYEELLAWFFDGGHAYRGSPGGQYRSAIWTRGEDQAQTVEQAVQEAERVRGEKVCSEIGAFVGFTLAEDYHQKYLLRRHGEVLREFVAMLPSREAFLGSTAVTRANAFLGGYGESSLVEEDVPRMGLSEGAQNILRERSFDRRRSEG